MIGEHYLWLNGAKHKVYSYDDVARKIGFHDFQAVMWPSHTRHGHQWNLNGTYGYIVAKAHGQWQAFHERRPAIYLGRTLKEAWVTLCLLADE